MRNYITNYDPFFDRFFLRANNCSTSHMMKTDIKENKSDYQMFIELPEVKKEDTRITLENGYLKVTATLNKEEIRKMKMTKITSIEKEAMVNSPVHTMLVTQLNFKISPLNQRMVS